MCTCNCACSQEVHEIRTAHAETISELEKTNKLLALQTSISEDCRKEVVAVQNQLRQVKSVYETRLQNEAQLLDIKQGRVKVRMLNM